MRRHQLQLPDADLAYLSEGSTLFDDYVEAVDWAQDYALLNRSEMMRRVLDVLAKLLRRSGSTGSHQLPPQLHRARNAWQRGFM
jgi:RNA-splicing ligase RtcB